MALVQSPKTVAKKCIKETLLQKRFIVSAVKSFFVSVSPADTILRIQKIDYFSYRLFPADTQNRFSKIKKNRSPDLGTLAPDRALLADARRAVGPHRASIEQWEQWGLIVSTAAYSLPPPSTTAAKHHLRRLRPQPPRTPTWPSRFGRPP
jgi:hypothetical protein